MLKTFFYSFKHENLCKFPSEFFYDDKLETAEEVKRRQPDNVKIWPKGGNYPFVFYNVEGKEESLVVSTDQGNENSKKNQKEIRKVVSDVLTKTPAPTITKKSCLVIDFSLNDGLVS